MKIDEQISREIGVHGPQWNSMHEGYFADMAVAAPLIETITRHLSGSQADIIVDLGGGTGFILLELAARGVTANMTPVNLDCSAIQLETMEQNGISRINGLISDFRRNDIAALDKRVFFIMRSVLHYFGRDGLMDTLRHIRHQARRGEMFIHQTACFENEDESRCINFLYQEMGTPKWYPTIDRLRNSMVDSNWRVIDIFPAAPLKLSSAELGQRYGLDSQTLRDIRNRVTKEFGEKKSVFQPGQNGFTAYLHYRICVSEAV